MLRRAAKRGLGNANILVKHASGNDAGDEIISAYNIKLFTFCTAAGSGIFIPPNGNLCKIMSLVWLYFS